MKEYTFGPIKAIHNEHKATGQGPDFLTEEATSAVRRIHHGMMVYQPTPLVDLDTLAGRLGIEGFFVKDESYRFGLNAFKGLGGIYALTQIIARELRLSENQIAGLHFTDFSHPPYVQEVQKMVFTTATDGNHGRGISWAAGLLGCECHVYMPKGSSEARAEAIRSVNPRAEVVITDKSYDGAVAFADSMAKEHGWHLVQDTSWPGYEEIPTWIVQGYTTMAAEACEQLEEVDLAPTHIFVQAGVGAMAGGVVGYLANRYEGSRPKFIVVEPETMACVYQSAKVDDGEAHEAADQGETIMAGLNCETPCGITWPVLRDFADWYVKCPDWVTAHGMRLLANPVGLDRKVVSGESGAVTTGLAHLLLSDPAYKELAEQIGFDHDSVVLCFSTEGDTDPAQYEAIVEGGAYPDEK